MICPGPIRLCPAQNDQKGVRAHVVKFGSLLVWVFCRRPQGSGLIIELVGTGDPAWARTQAAADGSGAVRRVLGVGRVRTRLGSSVPHPCGVANILERRSWGSFALPAWDDDATERRARLERGGD